MLSFALHGKIIWTWFVLVFHGIQCVPCVMTGHVLFMCLFYFFIMNFPCMLSTSYKVIPIKGHQSYHQARFQIRGGSKLLQNCPLQERSPYL